MGGWEWPGSQQGEGRPGERRGTWRHFSALAKSLRWVLPLRHCHLGATVCKGTQGTSHQDLGTGGAKDRDTEGKEVEWLERLQM